MEQIRFDFTQVAATLEALRIAGFIDEYQAKAMDLDGWLRALLGGEYKQTTGQLAVSNAELAEQAKNEARRKAAREAEEERLNEDA